MLFNGKIDTPLVAFTNPTVAYSVVFVDKLDASVVVGWFTLKVVNPVAVMFPVCNPYKFVVPAEFVAWKLGAEIIPVDVIVELVFNGGVMVADVVLTLKHVEPTPLAFPHPTVNDVDTPFTLQSI